MIYDNIVTISSLEQVTLKLNLNCSQSTSVHLRLISAINMHLINVYSKQETVSDCIRRALWSFHGCPIRLHKLYFFFFCSLTYTACSYMLINIMIIVSGQPTRLVCVLTVWHYICLPQTFTACNASGLWEADQLWTPWGLNLPLQNRYLQKTSWVYNFGVMMTSLV